MSGVVVNAAHVLFLLAVLALVTGQVLIVPQRLQFEQRQSDRRKKSLKLIRTLTEPKNSSIRREVATPFLLDTFSIWIIIVQT